MLKNKIIHIENRYLGTNRINISLLAGFILIKFRGENITDKEISFCSFVSIYIAQRDIEFGVVKLKNDEDLIICMQIIRQDLGYRPIFQKKYVLKPIIKKNKKQCV